MSLRDFDSPLAPPQFEPMSLFDDDRSGIRKNPFWLH